MTSEKGLTGIREDARGFVGNRPAPKYDTTRVGRSRIKFCIACGQSNESVGKYPTWRFCVAYAGIADYLKDLRVGNLVKVSGWVSTEILKDELNQPVLNEKDRTKTKEHLIVYKAEIVDYKRQPELQPTLIGT